MNNIVELNYKKFCSIVEQRRLFESVEQFLILFSAGKDCTMMLDLFLRYYDTHNLTGKISVFNSVYPKHMYYENNDEPTTNFQSVKDYWNKRGVQIKYVTPNCDDFDDDDQFGCRICKRSRKLIIDEYVNALPIKTAILTGFTMNDALAYLNMLLLYSNFDISHLKKIPSNKRGTAYKALHKMVLREELPNGKYMIRPLLPFHENEVQEYLRERGIPYITKSCKISKYKFKRKYSSAIEIYPDCTASYEGIENFLSNNGINLNNGSISFEDVKEDNYFIDC